MPTTTPPARTIRRQTQCYWYVSPCARARVAHVIARDGRRSRSPWSARPSFSDLHGLAAKYRDCYAYSCANLFERARVEVREVHGTRGVRVGLVRAVGEPWRAAVRYIPTGRPGERVLVEPDVSTR